MRHERTRTTVGERLYWAYANLAMAHAAVEQGATAYGTVHYAVRSRLYKGLRTGAMNLGSFADDERLKMLLPQACCYCGSRTQLSIDHLIPQRLGGQHTGDNLVWACRSCNSAKGGRDLLVWLSSKGSFPSVLLFRRYLKLAIQFCEGQRLLDVEAASVDTTMLPFALDLVPQWFPPPGELTLWAVPL